MESFLHPFKLQNKGLFYVNVTFKMFLFSNFTFVPQCYLTKLHHKRMDQRQLKLDGPRTQGEILDF